MSFLRIASVVLGSVAMAACSSSSGNGEAGTTSSGSTSSGAGTTGGASTSAGAGGSTSTSTGAGGSTSTSAGAGGSSSTGAGGAEALFLGTWTVTAGMSQITCPGVPPASQSDVGGVEVITSGETAGTIVVTSQGNGCSYPLSVSGGTATATPGVTCQLLSGQICGDAGADGGVDTSQAVIHKDVMMTTDGKTMTETWSETLPPSCDGSACSATGTDTLTKS
jgi:hypothetical protein